MAEERLQKIIARAGFASRRKAEEFILHGRVRVNGEVKKELGTRADPDRDTIEVEGFGYVQRPPLVYVALHKPIHVVSTVQDPEKRTTVIDLLGERRATGKRAHEGELPRLFPIGRLDYDAEGLIILTNDGELSNALLQPRQHVPKTYLLKVKGEVEEKVLERLRAGVRLRNNDGQLEKRKTQPADARIFKKARANTWIELTITEGRNHQIKRMCEAVGLFLIRLIRTDFAGVTIDPLGPGDWRFLRKDEVGTLRGWRS